uniref:Inter-alpha-trypsin inhibitor heavy chain H3 n=1 Tax=Hydra vulgaris TaxID=6087 RepID=T2ME29_HYDVU
MNDKKLTVACSTEYKDYPFKEKLDIWTLISLKAPSLGMTLDEKEHRKRAPIDLVVVIDKSGSMAGEKLALVKKTLEFVVSQLNEKDRLCLITFDTSVYLDFKLTPMTPMNKYQTLKIIKDISPGSMTNLCGGLMKGLCEVIDRADEEKNEVASVLLFTDGFANKGGLTNIYCSSSQTAKYTIGIVGPKTADASIYTFGFGSNHNAQMLKEISDAGSGMYYYIENVDMIAEAFGQCLGGLLSTVAQGIQVEIMMENKVSIKKVHSNQPTEKQGSSIKINMGDLQSEESRDVVLELSIDSLDSPTDCQTLFNIKLNYFNVINECLESSNAVLTVLRPEKCEDHNKESSNIDLNKQVLRINVTKAMNNAYEKAEEGDFSGAADFLEEQLLVLNSVSSRLAEDDQLQCMLADVALCGKVTKKAGWFEKGRKALLNTLQQHERQRSSNLKSKSYATKEQCYGRVAAKGFVLK